MKRPVWHSMYMIIMVTFTVRIFLSTIGVMPLSLILTKQRRAHLPKRMEEELRQLSDQLNFQDWLV